MLEVSFLFSNLHRTIKQAMEIEGVLVQREDVPYPVKPHATNLAQGKLHIWGRHLQQLGHQASLKQTKISAQLAIHRSGRLQLPNQEYTKGRTLKNGLVHCPENVRL